MKNFFSKTCGSAFEVLLSSTHDIAWAMGPFSEVFGTYQFCFMGSIMSLESAAPGDDAAPEPMPMESSVSIDWSLPMTESAQTMLFKRILAHWDRVTGSFPVGMKKKYRMNSEEMLSIRNIAVLFDQLLPHLTTKLSGDAVQEWQKDIASCSKRDSDILSLLNSRPARFSMSMLESEQENAKASLLESEQKRIEDKEMQQAELDQAQWSFFKGALQRDQAKLQEAQIAPKLVRQKLHSKQVQRRAKLAVEGENACKAYQA